MAPPRGGGDLVILHFIYIRKIAALRPPFSSSCGGLQPLAATLVAFEPKIHLENFAEIRLKLLAEIRLENFAKIC